MRVGEQNPSGLQVFFLQDFKQGREIGMGVDDPHWVRRIRSLMRRARLPDWAIGARGFGKSNQVDQISVIPEHQLRNHVICAESRRLRLVKMSWDGLHRYGNLPGIMSNDHGPLKPRAGEFALQGGFGWSQGTVSPQPHVGTPPGTYEEEFGRRGFFGRVSHLYHRHPPTGWLRIEGPLAPHAYFATETQAPQSREGQAVALLENSDVIFGIAKLTAPMGVFFRNGDADEVRFIHSGSGRLETDFGDMDYSKGDYLVIPRGTTYRFVPQGDDVHVVIESMSEIELPDRGMLGRHAQFDPMIMRTPLLPKSESKAGARPNGEFELWIKREGQLTRVFYPWSPINTAGWKGDLAPWAINVADIRPVISPRYHLPPSVHTTFVARNFVICSFLPRPLESEEGAMKVPFYHRNIDFDEVLFYHEGNFFSREGIKQGSITWHPQGIHHGPHPNAEKNAADKTETHEIAVMLDTRNPLRATQAALAVEAKDYAMSWRADQKR
jgi:homogentisate 1,2-dioxygenase